MDIQAIEVIQDISVMPDRNRFFIMEHKLSNENGPNWINFEQSTTIGHIDKDYLFVIQDGTVKLIQVCGMFQKFDS